jgi:acyl-CoA reductase-like NAD-dependent aldehyde dehydrogenase
MTTDASYTVPLLINGKEVTTETTFSVTSPSSHRNIWQSSSASVEDAKNATAAAQAAFPAWAKLKPAAKRDIFMKAASIIEARADMLRDVAGRLSSVMGHIPTCESEGTAALVIKEPLGVVLAIAPWLVKRLISSYHTC